MIDTEGLADFVNVGDRSELPPLRLFLSRERYSCQNLATYKPQVKFWFVVESIYINVTGEERCLDCFAFTQTPIVAVPESNK